MKIYIDGTLYEEADAKISVFDHGLLYGDGIFEGIRFYNGLIFKLEEHLDRLEDSAKAIWLDMPWSRDRIREATLETIRANALHDGYIRLVVTRGKGTLGLSPKNCTPSLIIIAAGIQLYPEEFYNKGLEVVTCGTRRLPQDVISPAVKSLNYLNNVLAKIEAINAGAGEGLMLNAQGNVAECTGDNVFMYKKGQIFTPPISAGALGGITRAAIFEIAQELGLALKETNLTRYDLYTAEEIFLTGTAAEVIPVVKLDYRAIGTGVPGAVTKKIINQFRQLTQSKGTPIY